MSDITEKKRINNAINGVEFVLDVVSNENVSYSDSDSNKILLILTLEIQKEKVYKY